MLPSMRTSVYVYVCVRVRIAALRAAGGAPQAAEPARPAGSPGPGRGCWGTASGLLPSPAAGRAPEIRCFGVLRPYSSRGVFLDFTSHKNSRGSYECSHRGHPSAPSPEECREAPPAPLRRGGSDCFAADGWGCFPAPSPLRAPREGSLPAPLHRVERSQPTST